jgi:hypothetical protein
MCMSCVSMMWHCGDPLIVVYEMKSRVGSFKNNNWKFSYNIRKYLIKSLILCSKILDYLFVSYILTIPKSL